MKMRRFLLLLVLSCALFFVLTKAISSEQPHRGDQDQALQPQSRIVTPQQRFAARHHSQHLITVNAVASVTGTPTYPVTNLGTMRQQITGATDAAAIKTINTHNFFFKFYPDGRVDQAFGLVVPYASRASSAPCKPDCYTAMYSMYDTATGGNPGGKLAHNGHIIGAQLGGDWSNSYPLNFFPHFPASNTHNGRWWRMEMIARDVKDLFETLKQPKCDVGIYVSFTYPSSGTLFVPTGGWYAIDVEKSCYDNYLSKVSSPPAYAAAFIKAAKSNPVSNAFLLVLKEHGVTSSLNGYRLEIQWANDGTDKADEISTPNLYK